MANVKPTFHTDFQEFGSQGFEQEEKVSRTSRTAESISAGLTVLALLSSITIVGTASDTIATYKNTTLGSEYFLSIWPNEFDLRPTVALVICGAIIVLASSVNLAASKVPAIRKNSLAYNTISFLSPIVCLIASLTSTSFFYGVNSSTTNFSLQSWSCQWSPIKMNTKPHWEILCNESKVALYLTVMLIPLEVLVLATASWAAFAGKKQVPTHERKGSPAMSG